jgi:hypothetical protein
VPGVIELLLFDRAGDRPADRVPFEHLAVGHLVGADDPDPSLGQPLGVGVAPQDPLGPLLEPTVQVGGPPVPGAMGLEIDAVQDSADGAGAEGRDDAFEDGLAGQVPTGPVGDVQPPGDGLQAGQRDDLRPLEGGKSGRVGRSGPVGNRSGARSGRTPRNVGRSARRRPRRTACGRRRRGVAHPQRWPGRSGHGGPGTKAGNRCERSLSGRGCRGERGRADRVVGRAWDSPPGWR